VCHTEEPVETGSLTGTAVVLKMDCTKLIAASHVIAHSVVIAYSLMRQHTPCLMHGQFRYQQCMVIVADKAKASIGCSVLGKGLLPSLDYAAERLITPGARVVPAAIQVKRVM